MGVYIGAVKDDYSAMQGPAHSGFHVPTKDERQGLNTIMTSLSLTTGNSWKINLHLPLAGRRNYSNSSVASQGSAGNYWSSSNYSYGQDNAYRLNFSSSTINPQSDSVRSYGFSVRCFKNSFTSPTSSWTVITGTLGGGGIFRNQTEGIISITSDGTTGYTIQDKNLGATTVYNNGDTLSEANCGTYFQWGNNYGFSRYSVDPITTSSTQVDASNYGPGNYYSSDTFITVNGRWDTTDNGNLRGGVTGLKPTSLKNAYIGEYRVPGENTVAYFPFEGSETSKGKYSLSMTKNGTISYTTLSSGKVVANFQSATLYSDNTFLSKLGNGYTVSYWYTVNKSSTNRRNQFYLGQDFRTLECGATTLETGGSGGGKTKLYYYGDNSIGDTSHSGWLNVVITVENHTSVKMYINGNLYTSHSTTQSSGLLGIGYSSTSGDYHNGYMSEFIVEDKSRTAQEITNYYNSTKSNYQSSQGGGSGGSIPAEPL